MKKVAPNGLAEFDYLDLDPDPVPVAPKVVPLPRRRTVMGVWEGVPASCVARR